jgi:hypothetical protein
MRPVGLREQIRPGLLEHLTRVKLLHQTDLAAGYGRVAA